MRISRTLFFIPLLFTLGTATGTVPGFVLNDSLKNTDAVYGTFSGKVTDAQTGLPIEAVTVYISDIRSGTATDVNGHFRINNIPQGNHLVEISHIGYSSIVESIVIEGDVKKDYALSESIIENNAVVITGVTGATQLKKVPFAVSVMRKEDFFQNTSSNIIESLTKIGGVSTLATGPAISKPVIRGLSYNRVLTINDGVRQEGQQWGDEHGIEIDEASVSKIELLKGPASIIYGSDAMAGVVNIISNVPVADNTIKGNLSTNYQTNNNLSTLFVNISGNKNGLNWNLYSSNKAAGDYKNKYDGRVFNSKFTENNIGGYIGYNGNWGFSHLLVSQFNLKAGLIEGERDAAGFFIKHLAGGLTEQATHDDFKSSTPLIPYQHIRHFKIASDNNIKMGKNYINFNIGYQQNKREEFGNPDDVAERSLFFDLKTITYTAQFHLAANNGWKNSIGINGMQQNNSNHGVEQLIPDYNLFDFGVYAFTQKTINKITLSGGLRFDNRHINTDALLDGNITKGNGVKKSFSNISGSAGLAAQVSKAINVKFNIARGFRAPSIPELTSNGAHEGTIRYEYGNPDLKSETSLQLDGGIEYAAEHISIGLSAFYNSFDNFIFYRKLQSTGGGDSTVVYNGAALTAFTFDQTRTSLTGLEATFDLHPHPLDWLHILNTFSVVSGQLRTPVAGSKYLPFIPASKLSTEFRGSFKNLGKNLKNFYVKFELDNTFSKKNIFAAYNTETTTPGYTLMNAGIGTDFVNRKNKTLFSLSISGINLADVAYQNHLSRLKYAEDNVATGRTGVFNMGRNFSIKLNLPLTVNLK
ncbi:MAG: TonB-dependent receptor [Ferruginibacter sp.]